jgi:hypothetical protein
MIVKVVFEMFVGVVNKGEVAGVSWEKSGGGFLRFLIAIDRQDSGASFEEGGGMASAAKSSIHPEFALARVGRFEKFGEKHWRVGAHAQQPFGTRKMIIGLVLGRRRPMSSKAFRLANVTRLAPTARPSSSLEVLNPY